MNVVNFFVSHTPFVSLFYPIFTCVDPIRIRIHNTGFQITAASPPLKDTADTDLPTLEEFSKSGSTSPVAIFHKAPVLRLIDFANVTFPGFCKDDIFHEGPDQGFLFGLNNLITILETIWKKSC